MAHDVDTAVEILRKNRQAFAAGIVGINTLAEIGERHKNATSMKPMATNIETEMVHAGWFLPSMKWNVQMVRATENRLAMQLIVGNAEAIKHCKEYVWKDSKIPEFQFLRQIRNAAAHNNRLEFPSDCEPRDNTEWNEFEITRDMEGEPVFTDIDESMLFNETVEQTGGFMQSGDALSLTTELLDIIVDDSNYKRTNIRDIPNE